MFAKLRLKRKAIPTSACSDKRSFPYCRISTLLGMPCIFVSPKNRRSRNRFSCRSRRKIISIRCSNTRSNGSCRLSVMISTMIIFRSAGRAKNSASTSLPFPKRPSTISSTCWSPLASNREASKRRLPRWPITCYTPTRGRPAARL